jgi:plastocyanin
MRRRAFMASLAGAAATGAMGDAAARTTLRQQQQGGTTHTVQMVTEGGSYYFDPVGLYVNPGDTVEWVIQSGAHSSTSYSPDNPNASTRLIPQDAQSWDSGIIEGSGASFSYTFNVTGTYDYYCIPHKTLGMVGRIVCGQPGGPATNQPIPNDVGGGTMPDSQTIVKKGSLSYPYIPGVDHGGPPLLFWGGLGLFSAASVYLYSVYDRSTGRYSSNRPEDEPGIEQTTAESDSDR